MFMIALIPALISGGVAGYIYWDSVKAAQVPLPGFGQLPVAPAPPPGEEPPRTFLQSVKAEFSTLGSVFSGSKVPAAVEQWRPLAEKYAQINSILDPEEILAIIWTESTGNRNGINPNDPSYGLMGVTMLIGRAYAGVTSSDQLYDPDTNVKAGSGFLAFLKTNYEDNYPLSNPAIAWVDAYNEGEPNLKRGRQDTDYANKFIAHLAALKS